jgi:hypothetical protein
MGNPYAKYLTPETPQPRLLIPAADPKPGEVLRDKRTLQEIENNPLDTDVKLQSLKKSRTDQALSMAQDYNSNPDVKAYNSILPTYAAALESPDTPAGDQGLVYAMAKVMQADGSAVRSEEVQNTESLQPYVDQIKAQFGKQLNADGTFLPSARQQIRQAMAQKMGFLNRAYINQRVRYKEQADRAGLDPRDVVGDHTGIGFQETEAKFLGHPVSQADYRGNVIPSDNQPPWSKPTGTPPNSPAGGPPDETGKYAGADIQMHMDSPENAQGYRFTPTQETALREYLTGGNATPEGYGRMMTAFAAAQGVNVDDAYTQSATAQGQKLIEAAKAGKLGDGMAYTQSDKDYRDSLLKEANAGQARETSELLTSGALAGGLDEARGIVGGASSLIKGNGFEKGYVHDRDLTRAVRDNAYEKRPIISGATEMLGALVTPGGVSNEAVRGGSLAKRMVAMGKAGRNQGIAAGYGYGEGAGDSIKGAAIGGATGALIGGGLPIAGKPISAAYNFATKRPAITAARDAAERLNINSTPAATGGAMSRGLQMAYGNLPGSSAAVESAATRETGDLANAARTVANDLGPVSTPSGSGKAISRGAGAWERVTRKVAQRLYGERDKLMGGPDVPIVMAESRAAIDSFAQRFPNSPVLATLRESPAVRRLEKAMPDKGVLTLRESTEILSEARAALRNARRNGAVTPAMETRIAKVEQAIENDVLNAARQVDQAAGRSTGGAADAQMTADKYYRNRAILKTGALKLPLSSRTDDVLASSEAVFKQVSGDMARVGGNTARLKAVWESLPAGAKHKFAATKFDELGRATNGQQNADQTAWSFNTFLTNYSSLDEGARKIVFGGQEDKIRDIATYAERLRQVDKSRNFSNTAKNTIAGAFMTVLGGALWKGDVQTAAATVAAVPAAWGSAKLFLSTPAMRTWTARALKATQQAANTGNAAPLKSLTGQLAGVAAREPAISGDIISLQNYLAAKFSETPSRAAATPGQDRNDRRPPPENNGQ